MRLCFSLLLIAAIVIAPPFTALVTRDVRAQEPSGLNADPSASITQPSQILQDYIYGYSAVAMEAARALQTAVPNATVIPGRALINQFAYRSTLARPEECTVIRPNADTLYTNARLDLTREPIILHVPDTAGRYYLIPMLDAYSNLFASIGSRATGHGEGNFAIVGPLWRGTLPEGLRGVIHAPTNTIWMIGRTLVHGERDLPNAVRVTRQYKLVPLSAYPQFLATGNYAPPPFVPVTRPNPDFIGKPITLHVGSETGLVPNPDGSIDILLESTAPSTHQSNWLPVPSGPFNLSRCVSIGRMRQCSRAYGRCLRSSGLQVYRKSVFL